MAKYRARVRDMVFDATTLFHNKSGTGVVVIVRYLDLQLPMQSVPITTSPSEFETC
jgi:hypothetical protein